MCPLPSLPRSPQDLLTQCLLYCCCCLLSPADRAYTRGYGAMPRSVGSLLVATSSICRPSSAAPNYLGKDPPPPSAWDFFILLLCDRREDYSACEPHLCLSAADATVLLVAVLGKSRLQHVPFSPCHVRQVSAVIQWDQGFVCHLSLLGCLALSVLPHLYCLESNIRPKFPPLKQVGWNGQN